MLATLRLVTCAARREEHGGSAARPDPVPKLPRMLEQREAIGVILGEMQTSGTVYRLTTRQRDALRSAGMPVAILSDMDSTYDRVVHRHPELATSNDRWVKVGEYWYGGLPAGWPREWVTP